MPALVKKKFKRQVRLCFRREGDHGIRRTQATHPDPKTIVKRLELVRNDFQSYLTGEAKRQIQHLEGHGECLSDIPLGANSSKNENLHRQCRQRFKGRTSMSLHLFNGLLTCFVVLHNRKRQGNSSSLINDPKLLLMGGDEDTHIASGFGLAYGATNSETIDLNFEVPDKIDLKTIASNIRSLQAVARNFQISSIEHSILEILTVVSCMAFQEEDVSKSIHEQEVSSLLLDFSLSLVEKQSPMSFPKAFVEQVKSHAMSDSLDFEELIETIEKVKAHDMLSTAANFTKSVIIVLCPFGSQKVQSVLPDEILDEEPVILLKCNGYYATKKASLKRKKCSCGSGKVPKKKMPCSTTMCPCKRDGAHCTNFCKCKQCQNNKTAGASAKQQTSNQSITNRREQHAKKLTRKRNHDVMMENQVSITQSWKMQEVFALFQLKNHIKSYYVLAGCYNKLADMYPELHLNMKKQSQVQKKLSLLK